MSDPRTETLEQVFLERAGVSIEDAVATGMDVVDERVSAAAQSGVDVEERVGSLGSLLEKLTEPATVAALGELMESLPQLVQLAKMAKEMPNLLATVGDMVDDYQGRCATEGIDVERALVNSVRGALWFGSQVDPEQLEGVGELLRSDILNSHAIDVVDNAAKSLSDAREEVCESAHPDRIGFWGLLAAMRKPEVQKSLAFAVRFGECFGRNLDTDNKSKK